MVNSAKDSGLKVKLVVLETDFWHRRIKTRAQQAGLSVSAYMRLAVRKVVIQDEQAAKP